MRAKAASERALRLYSGHLISRNEAREIVGFEPVLGGDTIYGSVGDVAQAEDYFTNHGINDPAARHGDNSVQAYHEARPEADPANQARAEEAALAEGRAAAEGENPRKPKPGDGKPAKDKAEAEKAFGQIFAFADGLKSYRPKTTEGGGRKVA